MSKIVAACSVCRVKATVIIRLDWFCLRFCNKCWARFLDAVEREDRQRALQEEKKSDA